MRPLMLTDVHSSSEYHGLVPYLVIVCNGEELQVQKSKVMGKSAVFAAACSKVSEQGLHRNYGSRPF